MVGPSDTRLSFSTIPGATNDLPRFNDPALYQTDNLNNPLWYTATDTLNELRQDRGAYRLSVVHESFSEGQLVNEEVRYCTLLYVACTLHGGHS